MLNAIPFIGWLLSFLFSVSLAVPFWLIWTVLGIGEMFDFLPAQFHAPGFWVTVGLFMCLSIFRSVALPVFFGNDRSD